MPPGFNLVTHDRQHRHSKFSTIPKHLLNTCSKNIIVPVYGIDGGSCIIVMFM